MNTLLIIIIVFAAQCGVSQCQAKKVVSTRLDYMEYTIEQFQLGLISLSSADADQIATNLARNDEMAVNSSPAAGKRHIGPFDRTPLLSRVDDKQSRVDDEEADQLPLHYEFNHTMGSYVIFHRTDENDDENSSGNETVIIVEESSSILTANAFDFTASPSAEPPSTSPTLKKNFCPPPYNSLKVDYTAGSLVEVNGFIFKCNSEPYTPYCNYPIFDDVMLIEMNNVIEEVTKLWLNAWAIVGECENTSRPTFRPNTQSRQPAPSGISMPSWSPTTAPSWSPTISPTISTPNPTSKPSRSPITKSPSSKPTLSNTPTFSPSISPTQNPSNNPTLSPSYSPSTWSPTNYKDSPPNQCSKSEIRVRIELLTDGFPGDTSWVFKRKREKRGRKATLLMRSKDYTKVAQHDIREVCLNQGEYEFVLRDRYSDGLCCDHGTGFYKILISSSNTNYEWQLIAAGAEFLSSEVRQTFEVRENGQVHLVCAHSQRKIRIEINTDNFGEDTSWKFRDASGVVIAKSERTYGKRELDFRDLCLEDKSIYDFTVYDAYADGLCCQFGRGHYKIIAYNDELFNEKVDNGVVVLHGGMFFEPNITHIINTTTPAMTDRDIKWLDAHNIRRKKYHNEYEKEYVPLQWSDGLKAEAQVWADSLLDSCGEGMFHDPLRIYGENAAGNTGRGSWGEQREPEKILTRFVEYELADQWPQNGHLTQVLWRASRYVGCAESHKVFGGGKQRQCHTQVRRYAVTGNCNMGRFKKQDLNNITVIDWLTPTLEDANFCGPLCPPDGCHA